MTEKQIRKTANYFLVAAAFGLVVFIVTTFVMIVTGVDPTMHASKAVIIITFLASFLPFSISGLLTMILDILDE